MLRIIFLLLIFGKIDCDYCYWKNFDPNNPTSASCIPTNFVKEYDYYGRKNKTINDVPCCTWLSCREEGDSEDSFNEHNYCRNVFQTGKTMTDDQGPWCYRKDNSVKELCFNDCPQSDYVCVSTTTASSVTTTTEDTTLEPYELPVLEDPIEHTKRKQSKVGRYVEPMTNFGFWMIVGTVIILCVMCALFPCIRIYAARRQLLKEGPNEAKKRNDVESYRLLQKIFRESARSPPTFEQFVAQRNRLGKLYDPKSFMEDD